MDETSLVAVVFGSGAILCGIGLALAHVDKKKVAGSSNPMLALFRFPAWRYGMAVILVAGGLLIVVGSGS